MQIQYNGSFCMENTVLLIYTANNYRIFLIAANMEYCNLQKTAKYNINLLVLEQDDNAVLIPKFLSRSV
jgi:hypothetical protein